MTLVLRLIAAVTGSVTTCQCRPTDTLNATVTITRYQYHPRRQDFTHYIFFHFYGFLIFFNNFANHRFSLRNKYISNFILNIYVFICTNIFNYIIKIYDILIRTIVPERAFYWGFSFGEFLFHVLSVSRLLISRAVRVEKNLMICFVSIWQFEDTYHDKEKLETTITPKFLILITLLVTLMTFKYYPGLSNAFLAQVGNNAHKKICSPKYVHKGGLKPHSFHLQSHMKIVANRLVESLIVIYILIRAVIITTLNEE